MDVILSIKPEFATKIFDGEKKFEFRRSLFKDKKVNRIVVYASAPISKIIGEFEINRIFHQDLDSLWSLTSNFSGISKDYYLKYFRGKKEGYAIEVINPQRYDSAFCIKEAFGLNPPQSFAYIRERPKHNLAL